ncbi:histidinol dehydrogenase, partial [Escherichia coli]|nr:histidinol dehydrogenase [Escherichia coli]
MKILTGTINELLNEVKAENNTNNSLQVESEVKSIIEKVKKDGDQALFDFTSQFDGVRLTELRVQTADIQSASSKVNPAFLVAL